MENTICYPAQYTVIDSEEMVYLEGGGFIDTITTAFDTAFVYTYLTIATLPDPVVNVAIGVMSVGLAAAELVPNLLLLPVALFAKDKNWKIGNLDISRLLAELIGVTFDDDDVTEKVVSFVSSRLAVI